MRISLIHGDWSGELGRRSSIAMLLPILSCLSRKWRVLLLARFPHASNTPA